MKKLLLLVILIALIAAVWVFRGRIFPSGAVAKSMTAIVVTSPELQSLAQAVGANYVTVEQVGAGDAAKINATDIFIFSGNGTDKWAEDLAPGLAQKQIIPMKLFSGEGSHTGAPNVLLAARLAHVLSMLDPAHASSYANNAQSK